MLIEKIVKSTLGIKDHRVVRVVWRKEGIGIFLDVIGKRRRECSRCGRRGKVRDRLKERRWRHVPLWNIPVFLYYRPCRVQCSGCGVVVEKIPWGEGKSRFTTPFRLALASWSKKLPLDVVGKIYGVCWNAVYSAVRQVVRYGLSCREKTGVVILGIDEISRRKRHHYHTQVYDLIRRVLLGSYRGRDEGSMRAFFEEWGRDNLRKIRGICCDMWAPYVKVIKEFLPHVILVFDKFHLIRHLLNAVDEVRREEADRLRESNPLLLKDTRYIWLKNPWNLTEAQRRRLSYLEKLNLKINRAYLLKENFRELWSCLTRSEAESFLKQWLWWASHSRLDPMVKFAQLLKRHQEAVLAYFDLRIDNGSVEAMNNNAKAISHRARGYRSSVTFSTLLMHCLGGLDVPNWGHKFA